jgi:hypothetical protein
MRRIPSRRSWLLSIAALASCRKTPTQPRYTNLGEATDSVRAAFNADVGKVRVLMLVSPS